MTYTILIDTTANITRAALTDETGSLCELCVEPQKKDGDNDTIIAGAIYKARVVSVVPSLDAAFVDLGTGSNAILHGFNFPAAINSKFRQPLAGVLRENSEVMVEVKRPGYALKGPKVSGDIGLNGRYMVLLPYTAKTFTSQKLPPKERRRLEEDSKKLSPRGKILRTNAAQASFAELEAEELSLINRWREIEALAAKNPAPCVLYSPDVIWQALEDWLSRLDIKEIICNDGVLTQKLKNAWPDLVFNVKRFEPKWALFARYNIESQIDRALNRRIVLPSGVSLVIEPTESMTVVDVNSGRFGGDNFEQTAFETNLAAAAEIARELRLRCIGGLVVIDFIDMRKDENRVKVADALRASFKNDPNKIDITGFNEAGLLTLKRSRVQRPWQTYFMEACTCCNTGQIRNARYFAQKLFREIMEVAEAGKPLVITAPPTVAAFFANGGQPLLVEMNRVLQTTVSVEVDQNLAMEAYHILQTSSNT